MKLVRVIRIVECSCLLLIVESSLAQSAIDFVAHEGGQSGSLRTAGMYVFLGNHSRHSCPYGILKLNCSMPCGIGRYDYTNGICRSTAIRRLQTYCVHDFSSENKTTPTYIDDASPPSGTSQTKGHPNWPTNLIKKNYILSPKAA